MSRREAEESGGKGKISLTMKDIDGLKGARMPRREGPGRDSFKVISDEPGKITGIG